METNYTANKPIINFKLSNADVDELKAGSNLSPKKTSLIPPLYSPKSF